MVTPEHKAIAAEIAAALGETEKRPRKQIERIVALMGEAWVRSIMAVLERGAHMSDLRRDGIPRTRGGMFFNVARKCGSSALGQGTITRRDFYRCFTDFPPKPRERKQVPPRTPKPPQNRRPKLPPVPTEPRRKWKVPEAEVYTIARRPR